MRSHRRVASGWQRRKALSALLLLAAALAPVAGSPGTPAYTTVTRPKLRKTGSATSGQAGLREQPCPVHVVVRKAPLRDEDVRILEYSRQPFDTVPRRRKGSWKAVLNSADAISNTAKLVVPLGAAVGGLGRVLIPSTQNLLLAAIQLGIPRALAHSRVMAAFGLLAIRCTSRLQLTLETRKAASRGESVAESLEKGVETGPLQATDESQAHEFSLAERERGRREDVSKEASSVWCKIRRVCEVVACEAVGAVLQTLLERPQLQKGFPFREEDRRISAAAIFSRAQRIAGQRWVVVPPTSGDKMLARAL